MTNLICLIVASAVAYASVSTFASSVSILNMIMGG